MNRGKSPSRVRYRPFYGDIDLMDITERVTVYSVSASKLTS